MRKLPDYGDYSGGVADGDREEEEERGSSDGNSRKTESDIDPPPRADDGRMEMESDDRTQGIIHLGVDIVEGITWDRVNKVCTFDLKNIHKICILLSSLRWFCLPFPCNF